MECAEPMSTKMNCEITTRGVVDKEVLLEFLRSLIQDIEQDKQVLGAHRGISYMVMRAPENSKP